MKKITLLGLFALVLALNSAGSSAYEEGPWCARFGGGSDYYENCSMRSLAMCLDEIRGTGGNTVCSPNPRARIVTPEKHSVRSRG